MKESLRVQSLVEVSLEVKLQVLVIVSYANVIAVRIRRLYLSWLIISLVNPRTVLNIPISILLVAILLYHWLLILNCRLVALYYGWHMLSGIWSLLSDLSGFLLSKSPGFTSALSSH